MAKQLNVNLAFNAETVQAKKAIEDLSQSLRKIQVQPSRMFDDTNLKKASQAAQDLEKHLRSAVNVNTGKLDLNKFSQSLSKAKQNLGDLYKDLSLAGSEGQTAFLNLAKSINVADSSSINLGSKLKELTTTLKNTARWEISSKIMHGFESAISSAYGYAQDLNKSLNDIRIVTGASSDEMARFAENANKAAKQLSTTTTDYTNASLIYFQQGLSDAEVAERTEVTIKMANAAGQSAQVVSDQLTAVWNNFYDGSKSLEYYADVMTALGAATASSTDEIAGGLEKFAAIGETIGLSYEYAASALATITSNTRQSEEVVGTALKTIFARIQGLNLGETLDDGTTLNKYSKALQSVGISIFDQAGELKKMDNILNEMADKWDILSKAQQVALAQTVAGTRQYTQLVALMDNWDDGSADSMTANLETSYGAEGALQEQADIYAESWEAAQKRVKAAAEGIFQELLNDDFFIDILNGFEGFLTGINNVIDGVGGLKTILLSVGGIFLKQYAKEIPAALSALGSNIDVITGKAEKNRQKMLEENKAELFAQKTTFMSDAQIKELETMRQVSSMTVELEKNRKNLSQAEIEAYEHNIDMAKAYGESSVALAKETKEIEKKLSAQKKQAISKTDVSKDLAKSNTRIAKLKDERDSTTDEEKRLQLEKKINEEIEKRNKLLSKKSNISKEIDDYAKLHKQQQQLTDVQENLKNNAINWAQDTKDLDKNSEAMQEYNKKIQDYLDMINQLDLGQDQQGNQIKLDISFEDFQKLSQQLQAVNGDAEKTKQIMEQWSKGLASEINDLDGPLVDLESRLRELNVPDDIIDEIKELAQASGQAGLEAEELKRRLLGLDTPVTPIMQTSEAFGVMASTMMEVWGAIEAVKNLGSIWSNEDLSTGEKMFQTVSAMLPVIVSLTSVLGKQNLMQLANAASSIAAATGLGAEAAASAAAAVATNGLNVSLGTLWALLRPIAAIIAAIVLVVGGLVVAFNAIKAASPEAQLESAKEATEKAAEAAQEAKDAYEDLLSTINKYDSAKDSLSELTKGTDEYTEALLEANEAARELIDTYGLTKIDVGDNGLIQLDKAELSEKKAEYRNQVEDTSSALTGAQKYENAKEDQVTRSNLYDDVMNKSTHYNTSGEYTYKDNYLINQDNISKVMEAANTTEGGWDAYFAEGGKNIVETMDWNFDNLDSYQQDFINALISSSTALEEANAAILANAAANEAATKAQLIQNLSDEEDFQNSKYQDELVEVALNTQSKEEAEAQDKLNTMSENAKYDEYAKLMGYTNNGIGTWMDGKQEFLDKDGNKIELTQDQVTAQLKEMYAQEGMEQNAINLINTMNEVMTRAGENKGVISAAISGDVNKLTIGQRGMSSEDVAAMVRDEEAKAMGFESAAAFGESFASVKENFTGEWKNLISNYVDSVQNQMKTMLVNDELDNLTLEQSRNLANAFETAFASSGQAGMETLQDMFLQTGEYSDEFANAIGTIDWETATPTTLQEALDASGVATYFTAEQLNNLINVMNNTTPSIETATTKFASLHDIIDGLEIGDTISEEQFNKFKEYGIAADDYFMLMADGTYKLIGDAEEFYNKINGESLEGFKENIEKNKTDNEVIDNLLSYDIEKLGTHDKGNDGYSYTGDGEFNLNYDTANTQLDLLAHTGYTDTAQIQEWRDQLADENLSPEEASKLAEDLTLATEAWIAELGGAEVAVEKLKNEQEKNNKEIEESEIAILSTAKSFNDLQKIMSNNDISDGSYAKALKGMASQYESCQDEIANYNTALEEYNENPSEETTNNLTKALKELEEATKAAEFEKFTQQTLQYIDALEGTDWKEHAKTLSELSEAYEYMLGIDIDKFSDGFLKSEKNLSLFEQALNGSQEAFDQLQANAALDMIEQQFGELPGVAQAALDEIASCKLEAGDLIDFGSGVEGVGGQLFNMYSAAVEAAQKGGASVAEAMAQANALMQAVGFDPPDVEMEEKIVTVTGNLPDGWTPAEDGSVTTTDAEGNQVTVKGVKILANDGGTYTYEQSILVPKDGGKITKSHENLGGGTKKNSGGGGGGSKKAAPTKKSDVVKRYKEVEDQLDNIREESDRVKNSFDKLYGAEQEAAIERLLELERQEIALMKQKAEEATKFMQEDLDELMKVSAEVDVEFKVDEKGNLVNYTEEMTELYEELTKLETKAGDEWDQKEQEEISALKEKITKLEEAIAAYEETRELLEDINAELDEMAGTPPLPLIKSDYLDVYYEVEDKLDDIEEKIKDLEREAEGLTGEERLEVLRQIQELEEERLKTLEEQKEIARQDMEDKKAAMEEIAERNDLNFEYDENGNITNYISEIEKLNKAYEELYDKVTEDGLVTDTELEALDAMREDMEQMEEYALGYRQAMESIEDIQNEIEDKGSGKANDRFVRSDYIDIYRETEDQLDDIDEKISDLERQADRLTGEERIAKLKEIQKLEKERLEVLKKQKEIAKQDLEDRKAALEEIATVNGLLFEFDENGNVTNYEEQLDKMLVKYEEEYTRAMADGVITATEQAILDAIDQDIEELKDAIDAYRDVVEQMEDIQNEMEDISEGGYVDMEQLDEIGDKLHDINQELDDIEEALNDSSEAADRLYGAARIKQMDKTTQMLEKEIDALERKKELQKDIIAEERSEVDTATSGKAQYDSNGNITNYHDLINSRKDAIRAREAELKADGDFTETEAAEIQEMIDDLQRMEEEIDEYEQALEDQEDIENAIDDAYYEWQDLNAEKLSYKLELTLDVNDRELAKIERQISRLEGNFYSRAEALALMVGGGMGGSSKLGQLNSQLGELEAHYAEVKHAYEAGKISHADYVEQTQQLQSEIENTAAEMEALQKQMDSYYKDTLAAARQELSFHISQIEHLTGVLGHYKNILTALGKSQDYEMMGTVLEGQVEALENEVQVAKRAMGMWQKEADEAYAKYQQALASGNQENADMYYQAYQEAINAANEAENKYYSKAQQWAQALKALMENTLAGLAQDLENALTGGTSFETINTQLKRASSLQEEYLTTTNKIYETTKMMRTAQNEIDKTTNSVAKKKLANFITETKQMQNQNKLSKYELSIQQAKYDLLLAEIALEEARFAKSTVRLRRDSEGNFGYVYTADAEAVANAEQKFEDAQNKLYNTGLDGANKYTEKYQQTLSEMYNTLTQLQTKYLQGGFENEAEYNAAVTEAKAYYYEKLGQYSDLYSVALTTDSRVVADAWSTNFADMTQQTENWMNAVTDYLGQVRAAFAEWEQESDRIARETVGTNLETVKQKVAGIVSESDAMVVSINNSVIPAIQSEINEVQRLTDQYAAMNGQMTQAIDNAYALSDALQNDIDASVEKEMANMEAAEQEETQTQLDILTQQYNKTLKAALEDNDISDEEQAKLDAIEREITALQNADSLIAEFEEAYKAAIADEVISDDEQEALNTIAQKLVDLKDEMAALEITNETLDALIAKIAEVESMESFIEKYRTAYKAALEDDNIISPAEQEGLDAIKEEIAQLRGFDEIATKETNETLSMIADQLTTAQVEENAHAKIVQDILDLISVNIGDLILKVSDIYNGIMSASGITIDTTDPASYDTGGYTGQWGPSGKWAMLHEKELILNKGDTANFLASLDLLDSILSTIDLHAMNSQFNSMINSPYIQGLDTKEALEQMVTIEANFPNATDKLEIEEAFKGLVNLASQYANRK